MYWLRIKLRRLHWFWAKSSSENFIWRHKHPIASTIIDVIVWSIIFLILFVTFDNRHKITQAFNDTFSQSKQFVSGLYSKIYIKPFVREMRDYYPDCDAAHQDNIYNIHTWEKAYRSELDSDSDGLACEPYLGKKF